MQLCLIESYVKQNVPGKKCKYVTKNRSKLSNKINSKSNRHKLPYDAHQVEVVNSVKLVVYMPSRIGGVKTKIHRKNRAL